MILGYPGCFPQDDSVRAHFLEKTDYAGDPCVIQQRFIEQ